MVVLSVAVKRDCGLQLIFISFRGVLDLEVGKGRNVTYIISLKKVLLNLDAESLPGAWAV